MRVSKHQVPVYGGHPLKGPLIHIYTDIYLYFSISISTPLSLYTYIYRYIYLSVSIDYISRHIAPISYGLLAGAMPRIESLWEEAQGRNTSASGSVVQPPNVQSYSSPKALRPHILRIVYRAFGLF